MYENYEKLKKSRNVTDYEVWKNTGISRSTLSDWKNGKYVPKTDKLQKIADYFEVPLEYFTTGEMPNYYTNEETAKIAQKIFETPGLKILFDAAEDKTPEDLAFLAEMAKKMKGTNNE